MMYKYVCKWSLVSFLWVVLSAFLFSGCDEIVVEPAPTIELHKGYTTQLYSLSDNVKWGSSNSSVATVSSTGLVTAVGAGKATIYTYSSSVENQEIICYLDISPTRNILFYIGADDDFIRDDAIAKINEIRLGWQPGRGELIIYMDRRDRAACLLRINDTKNNDIYGIDTIQVYDVENSADPEVLSRVIDTLNRYYPADSYGMVLFSHGSGWLPDGTLARPRSLIHDKDGGGNIREMEYYDFASAIPDNQFDFIIFEACLMSDVMVMYELRKKAKYVLASSAEIVTPGFQYIYEKEFMKLYDTKKQTNAIVSDFGQAFYDLTRIDLTLSIIKMDEMEKLALATKNALQGIDINEANVIIDSVQYFDRPGYSISGGYHRAPRYFDLLHTIEKLVPDARYKAFNDQLEKTVIWKAASGSFLLNYSHGIYIKRHCGLTTYIEQDAYPYLNSEYRRSSWYKAISN